MAVCRRRHRRLRLNKNTAWSCV